MQNGKWLLTSDHAHMTDTLYYRTKQIVASMAADPEEWMRKFSQALVKLSTLDVLVGNNVQICQQCNDVNDASSRQFPRFSVFPGRGF
jgi:hypothetical protein